MTITFRIFTIKDRKELWAKTKNIASEARKKGKAVIVDVSTLKGADEAERETILRLPTILVVKGKKIVDRLYTPGELVDFE